MHRLRNCFSQLILPRTSGLLLMKPPDCFEDSPAQTSLAILCICCRPCRERMMTVLAIVDHSAGSRAAHDHSSSSSSSAASCDDTRQCGVQAQLFETFLEEDVSVAQLAAYMCAAGLLRHWAAATGLPLPS